MGYYEKIKDELVNLISSFSSANRQFDEKLQLIKQEENSLKKEGLRINVQKEEVKQMALERQKGFPILVKAYDEVLRIPARPLAGFAQRRA